MDSVFRGIQFSSKEKKEEVDGWMVEYIMKWVWGKVYNHDTEKFSKLYAQVSVDMYIYK